MHSFIALIRKDADSDYGVSFPDLPGVATAGTDLDDARHMAVEALALHLKGMKKDGDPIPEPSSLDAIMADRENRDTVAILVEASRRPSARPPRERTARANITLPEGDLKRIDAFAEAHGTTRSGFLLWAAKREMARE
jgi:predicted RNase H-like HicB family nuclease